MPERCVCGHVASLHHVNPQTGDRVECWALADERVDGWYCGCRQFRDASDGAPQGGESE